MGFSRAAAPGVALACLVGASTLHAQCGVQQALAGDAARRNLFGSSVASAGDVAVIGALNGDGAADDAGAVYVYRIVGSNWSFEQKLTAPDGVNGDRFGAYPMGVSGDVIAVGAPEHAGGDGAVYFFRFDGSAWALEQQITGATDSYFGSAVAVDGDVAIVGAMTTPQPITNCGGAFIYRFDGSSWNLEASLQADVPQQHAFFGKSVALDGVTAAVGAYGEDGNAGAVYIYRDIAGWGLDERLTPLAAEPDALFGDSLALDAATLLVGARLGDGNTADSGAAYVFDDGVDGFDQSAILAADDGDTGDGFGVCVALRADFAAIGAFARDGTGIASGKVYQFARSGNVWSGAGALLEPGAAQGNRFGVSVAVSALCTLVGADNADFAFSNAGAAYFFCPSCFCGADRDGDGFLTGMDLDDFVTDFETGDVSADVDADGFVSGLDFDAYVDMFNAGC